VLLSAGADTDTFVEEIRMAGSAGASGFLAGRGIWGGAISASADETERIATSACRPDLERCRVIAERFATPLEAVGRA
jgi:tagatose-1,6-bisphosphate aldolase